MALIHCPECGKEVSDRADACIHCGYPLNRQNVPLTATQINGVAVDLDGIVEQYGKNKARAIKHLRKLTGLELREAKAAMQAAYARRDASEAHAETKKSFWTKLVDENKAAIAEQAAQKHAAKEHFKQLKREHIAYCPKCKSTSLTAHKKGFGIGKAAIGIAATRGLFGAVAGNLGAKKVRVTCLNCGHQFWAGKK